METKQEFQEPAIQDWRFHLRTLHNRWKWALSEQGKANPAAAEWHIKAWENAKKQLVILGGKSEEKKEAV